MNSTDAPEQIIINGQEYSPEDATQLIELGNKWKETESKLNTSLDKVYPEYTRLSQEKSTWLKEKEELEQFRAQKKETPKVETPPDIQQARKAAREIGLVDDDFLKEKGYMTRDEMNTYIDQKNQNQRQADEILKQAQGLEKKIDGSDGRVPFDADAVLTYAAYKNIGNIEEAYEQMNQKGNARWKDEQLAKEEKPGLTTLKAGGKKVPQTPKYTNGNLGQAIGEWLNGID